MDNIPVEVENGYVNSYVHVVIQSIFKELTLELNLETGDISPDQQSELDYHIGELQSIVRTWVIENSK